MKIKCLPTGEIAYSYSEYLATRHWRELRVIAYDKAEGKCKSCGRQLANSFVCHHVSDDAYLRIGKERMNKPLPNWNKKFLRFFGVKKEFYSDDVIAVCNHCHNGESENHKKLHHHIDVPKWARIERE